MEFCRCYISVEEEIVSACKDSEKDPITVNKWTEIYREIEEAYDACEEVAEIIRKLVVKNS